MNQSFILLHAENVNDNMDSVCHIILVPVINGERQPAEEFFLNPEAEFDLVMSGITERQVNSYDSYETLWPKIQARLKDFDNVLSSSAGNSARSIYKTLMRLGIEFDPIKYCNAKALCRKGINSVSYSFGFLNFILFDDEIHSDNPIAIAERWCDLVLKALKSDEELSIGEFMDKNKISLGYMSMDDFIPSRCLKLKHKSKRSDFSNVEVNEDEGNPFYGKNVVFTGKMDSLTRDEARSIVISIGGEAPDRLTKSTDYLVVGVQDLRVVGEKGLSAKMKKAMEYHEKGADIELIDELEFIEMIGKEKVFECLKNDCIKNLETNKFFAKANALDRFIKSYRVDK